MKEKKILIVAPNWLGDMVMAHTLIQSLYRVNAPKIDVLVTTWCKDIVSRMPGVNKVIPLDLQSGKLQLRQRYRIANELKAESYTHAYILPNSFKSALIPFFARIPNRIGWLGEMRYLLLTQYRKNPKQYDLMYQRYAALAYPDGKLPVDRLALPTLTVDQKYSWKLLQENDLDPKEKIVAISPGAAKHSAKCWPAKHYLSLIKYLLQQNKQIILLGSKHDAKVTQDLASNFKDRKVIDLAGKINLQQTVDVISTANVFVGNDSGLMHVASAVDTPVLVIYGPTSPDHTPPLSEKKAIIRNKLPCSPCFKDVCPLKHHRCMEDLSAHQVMNQLDRLFS